MRVRRWKSYTRCLNSALRANTFDEMRVQQAKTKIAYCATDHRESHLASLHCRRHTDSDQKPGSRMRVIVTAARHRYSRPYLTPGMSIRLLDLLPWLLPASSSIRDWRPR